MRRRAGSPRFVDFLPWKQPESVFLVLTKRKADSGDEIEKKKLFPSRAISNFEIKLKILIHSVGDILKEEIMPKGNNYCHSRKEAAEYPSLVLLHG